MWRVVVAASLLLSGCAPRWAVVYSKNTGRVRSFVIPEKNKELASIRLGQCEGIKLFAAKRSPRKSTDLADLVAANTGVGTNQIQGLITKVTRLTPHNDRYAVVDANGMVDAIAFADPQCDSVPDHELIQSETASLGDKYEKKTGTFK